MKTKNALLILFVVTLSVAFAYSCKPSEKNYRAAYEKAIDGRDSMTSIENTIYGKYRRNMSASLAIAGSDTVELVSTFVSVTDGGGAIKENLKPFNVVVGQFKQLVNAKSMRERLVDAGYPSAFVVQTAEPYYYVVLSSWPSKAESIKACVAVRDDSKFPIRMRDGLPFILQTSY